MTGCFWGNCSNKDRCRDVGACVAAMQAGGENFGASDSQLRQTVQALLDHKATMTSSAEQKLRDALEADKMNSKTYDSVGCADAMCADAERLEPPALGHRGKMLNNSEVQVSYDLAREDSDLTVVTITRVFENGFKVLAHLEGEDAEVFIDAWNRRALAVTNGEL